MFRHPPAEYRGAPLWCWNERLELRRLLHQLPLFAKMGFGGAHIHCRTGLGTPYLGDEFMGMVASCVSAGRRNKLLVWLYDEDRWPSGYAGGLVTADPRHRVKHLLFTPTPYNGTACNPVATGFVRGSRFENGQLLARYVVHLGPDGALASYRRLPAGSAPSPNQAVWYAYLETGEPNAWFNGQTYVDTLSCAAITRFIEVTHERYRSRIGSEFGRTVRAIFTDEPQHAVRDSFARPTDHIDLTIPFTEDFVSSYRKQFGADCLDTLPELFWELPDQRTSLARYRYHEHVTQRFATAFASTIGRWCKQHGLLLTGHMMQEPALGIQTASVGEAMRSLAHFDIPGIDMLCDDQELTTAKQAQSVAHQYARPGTMSELYGVTGWDFDFAGHKRQGDWQAALGVTLRVPHLSWVSMAGESKRDYPASIFYQSPWWQEYRVVEDHFARLNTVLTRGHPLVRVAVIHPIESYWLSYGPIAQTGDARAAMERHFSEITTWLLRGLIDFDYVSEALLPTLSAENQGRQFHVGVMRYDAVVVPALRTIRNSTLNRLESFAAAGGQVLFAGNIPELADARPSTRARRLAARTQSCSWDRAEILNAIAPHREVQILLPDGTAADTLLYQLRSDGRDRHLFLCHTDRERPLTGITITVKGRWQVLERDTMRGTTKPKRADACGATTSIIHDFPAHGSLLLTLRPGRPPSVRRPPTRAWHEISRLTGPNPITLDEPNVMLLDQAEWRWQDDGWKPREELLRIENLVRARAGLPAKTGQLEQPWAKPASPTPLGRLSLRFAVQSDVAVRHPQLALEDPASWQILWNGKIVQTDPVGWWVDEAIHRVTLPPFPAGRHTLTLTTIFTRRTNVEWCYLLGDFGVTVSGRDARIGPPVRQLSFGDWTHQGLPFYAGNVTYHCALRGDRKPARIVFSQFKAPLLKVSLDRQSGQPVAFAPFEVDFGRLTPRRHRLDVTAFGNRFNAFGHLHHTNQRLRWIGPDAWRSVGEDWAYEYQLRPMGILTAPRVLAPEA